MEGIFPDRTNPHNAMEKIRDDANWYRVFCTHILPIIYDGHNYKEECTKKLIGSFVTVSDEAFAIVCCINVCKERADFIKLNGNDTRLISVNYRKTKKLPQSEWQHTTKYTMTVVTIGDTKKILKTWNDDGKYKYGELRMRLIAERMEECDFDDHFMNSMMTERTRNTKIKGKVLVVSDLDPEDDEAMLAGMKNRLSIKDQLELMRRQELREVESVAC